MVRSTDVDHARVCTPRRRFVPGVFVRPGSGRHCTPRRGDPRLHALCRLYGARGRSLDAPWCRTFCCTAWKACLLYASSARRLAVGARRRRSSSGSGQRLREWPSLYASSWRSAAVRPLSAVRREGAVAGRALVQDVLLYGVEGVSVVVCVISTQPAVGARRRRSSSGPVSGCGGWPSLYVLVVATRGCTPSACCTARGGGRWTRVGAERSAVRRGRRVCRMRHQHAAGCRRSALAVIERVRSAAAGVAVTVRLVVRSAAVRPLPCVRRGKRSRSTRALVQDVLLYGVEGVSVVCVISTQSGCRRSALAVIKRVRSGAASTSAVARSRSAQPGCDDS